MNRVYYIMRNPRQFEKFPLIKPRKYSTLNYQNPNDNNNNTKLAVLMGCVMYYIYSRKIR